MRTTTSRVFASSLIAKVSCLFLVGLLGCAHASPLLAGGRTTPEGRAEIALGGAARVPYGGLDEEAPTPEASAPTVGGLAPVGRFSYGLTDSRDLAFQVAGAMGRVELRQRWWEDRANTLRPSLRIGAALEGGVSPDGVVVGGDVPLMLGFDATSVIEVWLGPRVGASYLIDTDADESGRDQNAIQLRVGGVFGLGAGFRHLHVMMELTAQYEFWLFRNGQDREGLVLTPAFALRYRI